MISFKLLILMVFSCITYANENTESIDYYKDGVYNTTSIINKHLREGLQETILDQYYGKYLVVANLEKLSFVDIIFYENIAEKERIVDIRTAKKTGTNENFMVFGSYERKADADMIQTRLLESGIETMVFKNTADKNAYSVNPLIVRKYLSDIRELIKDMPVKVVRIEKIISRNDNDKTYDNLTTKQCSDGKLDLSSFILALQNEWALRGNFEGVNAISFLKSNPTIKGRKSFYAIGEYIGPFRLVNLTYNDYKNAEIIELLGLDGETYFASRLRVKAIPVIKKQRYIPVKKHYRAKRSSGVKPKCGTPGSSDFCADEVNEAPSVAQPEVIGVKQNKMSRCDFSRIRFVKINNQSVSVSKTKLKGLELDVKADQASGGYVQVKSSTVTALVPESSFNSACQR